MNQLPAQIARVPVALPIVTPEYDFDSEVRWKSDILASYTSGSIQTFNSSGKPSDNRGDNTD